jgi:hypothetical protein
MELRAYSRQSPWDRSLRCSDLDREEVGAILREAHVAGRLDSDEFADRFGRALQARTYAELDSLLADLPVNDQPAPPAGPATYQSTGWGASAWPPPGWYDAGQQPTGYNPTGYNGPMPGPFSAPGQHGPARLWPVGAFFVMWLAIAFAVFAATSGHVLWLFFPLAWFFWARGGRRRWRKPTRQ